jgi:hypothetical protein
MRVAPHPASACAGEATAFRALRPRSESASVSSYKIEQRRVSYRGRDFHFVSYDGQPANTRRGQAAVPPMWYLMGPGKRWPVMEQTVGQTDEEVERGLLSWLKEQGMSRPADGAV